MTDFLSTYGAEIPAHLWQHVCLAGGSVLIAAFIGIPLGIACTRVKALRSPILSFASVIQTIPSLALFGFLIPLPFGGIGERTALIALTLYSLLPIVRNTYAGITGIAPAVRDAALGMGLSERQILFRVELPLASGVIIAGLRVSAVLSVGITTIAAAIGAGGLGEFIFRGVATVNTGLILAGAVPSALLALFFDAFLGLWERRLKTKMGTGGRA